MKRKLVVLAFGVALVLSATFIFSNGISRNHGRAGQTQMVVTQDGKLTVLAPRNDNTCVIYHGSSNNLAAKSK